jgi:hypothetical protein
MRLSHLHDDPDAPSDPKVAALIDKGMELVNQLDAIVREKYRDDPETLAEWEEASRIRDESEDDKAG